VMVLVGRVLVDPCPVDIMDDWGDASASMDTGSLVMRSSSRLKGSFILYLELH
jgi:hypothetical protein